MGQPQRGSSWGRAKAKGCGAPDGRDDAAGHETLYANADSLIKSDDGGDNWVKVEGHGSIANPSSPAISPNYVNDGTLAVAGQPDFFLKNSMPQDVRGSGGSMNDQSFAFTPSYPGGARPPALLVGADKSNLPVVERCTADLTCSSPAVLPGAKPSFQSFPVTLLPSTDFESHGVVFAQTGQALFVDGRWRVVPASERPERQRHRLSHSAVGA